MLRWWWLAVLVMVGCGAGVTSVEFCLDRSDEVTLYISQRADTIRYQVYINGEKVRAGAAIGEVDSLRFDLYFGRD